MLFWLFVEFFLGILDNVFWPYSPFSHLLLVASPFFSHSTFVLTKKKNIKYNLWHWADSYDYIEELAFTYSIPIDGLSSWWGAYVSQLWTVALASCLM